MQRQATLQDLLKQMFLILSNKPEFKELFKNLDIDALAQESAQDLTKKDDKLSPRTILDATRKNPVFLQKLFLTLLTKAIEKKYDPNKKGLHNVKLTPEQQDEIRLLLTAFFAGIQDLKLRETVVEETLKKLLKDNFSPRPKGPTGVKEEQPLKVYPVLVTDDAGNVVGCEGIFTLNPAVTADSFSEIESRGASDLQHLVDKLLKNGKEIQDFVNGEFLKEADNKLNSLIYRTNTPHP